MYSKYLVRNSPMHVMNIAEVQAKQYSTYIPPVVVHAQDNQRQTKCPFIDNNYHDII